MVDVLIRNVEEELYARFKSDAARRKIPLAEELKLAFENLQAKSGTGKDLMKIEPWRGKVYVKNASLRVDELAGDAALDDYRRIQRSYRASHGGRRAPRTGKGSDKQTR
ncbi:MAG TPA: hypothetical protein VI874_02845 [Candidatus Norongarragalinales archaeon]|nr:hypothetical protein [Candidatus Norongarragalinales archaeon]